MNDRQLVSEFLKNRSENAFVRLYRAKTPHLLLMAYRLCGNRETAEDILQQMWVSAIERLDTFRWESALKTWLTGILINTYRNQMRTEMRMDHVNMVEKPVRTDGTSTTTTDLESAIRSLPAGYREIAEMLQITEGTSKSQLYNARKKVRNYLSEEYIKN